MIPIPDEVSRETLVRVLRIFVAFLHLFRGVDDKSNPVHVYFSLLRVSHRLLGDQPGLRFLQELDEKEVRLLVDYLEEAYQGEDQDLISVFSKMRRFVKTRQELLKKGGPSDPTVH